MKVPILIAFLAVSISAIVLPYPTFRNHSWLKKHLLTDIQCTIFKQFCSDFIQIFVYFSAALIEDADTTLDEIGLNSEIRNKMEAILQSKFMKSVYPETMVSELFSNLPLNK